jgi:D-alanyl-D-alanine carboxypeptidase/D-alanyl-D-alanine-endopeptidase (penicillin-binding protein 4)
MASARRAVLATLRELGVPESGLVLADGSGLSRLDLVQPRQLTALLRGMLSRPEAETFRRSLPSAGVDGSLRRRFQGATAARGRVAAKTGYVARVVALSGYVPRRGREPLVFSFLVNDFLGEPAPVQALVDAFVDRLAALAGPAP